MIGADRSRRGKLALLGLGLLALATIVCTLPFGGGGEEADLSATIQALQAELESAQADQDAQPGQAQTRQPTAAAGAVSSAVTEDTFASDLGTFPLGEGMQLTDQAYLLGPFGECANDVGNFDNPIDCNAVCLTCGDDLANYRLEVQFSFEEGLSDRSFGVILRFVDEDGDALLDYEDYLLALGFNVSSNAFGVYLHIPNRINPWEVIKTGQAGLLRPGRLNRLAITASNQGRLMDIFLNQERMLKLTADHPQPGETLVREWADSGAVGLLILDRGVQARYDNFSLERLP